jgi:hypothetical protein
VQRACNGGTTSNRGMLSGSPIRLAFRYVHVCEMFVVATSHGTVRDCRSCTCESVNDG